MLRTSLATAALEDNPTYEALSYVWGTHTKEKVEITEENKAQAQSVLGEMSPSKAIVKLAVPATLALPRPQSFETSNFDESSLGRCNMYRPTQ